jgi:hypothetical protein
MLVRLYITSFFHFAHNVYGGDTALTGIESTPFRWEHSSDFCNADIDAEATIWSCFTWIPGFLKFHVIPLPLKFLFLVLWSPVRRLLFEMHKKVVLVLCQLDAVLSRKPRDVFATTRGAEARFSRSLALSRLHCNRNFFQDVGYWAKLVARRRG